jgi:hypothetical protein
VIWFDKCPHRGHVSIDGKEKETFKLIKLNPGEYIFLFVLFSSTFDEELDAPRSVRWARDRGSSATFSMVSHRMGDQKISSYFVLRKAREAVSPGCICSR